MLIGEAPRIADRIREMAEKSGADEIMVITSVHDPTERRRSYDRLVAELG
jgi:alkanesulfonate monooxygenase SsuD/methylene tetrahydromethanopterin reductase-like flavin-dependent oxidoreductase (luciferase family)